MMFTGSNVNGKALLRENTSSPVLLYNENENLVTEPGEEPEAQTEESFPCWATQALCSLKEGEQELSSLREHQTAEVEAVNQGLERAIIGVQTEEHLLLERVAQDHRDTQRHLDQLQRENAAAARVAQSLVNERLQQLDQIKKDIQMWAYDRCGTQQNRLLKCVSELLQPWEITLSLKRVTFRPSSQQKPISFGDIRVQQHNLTFPIRACGTPDEQCDIQTDGVQEEAPEEKEEEIITPYKTEAGQVLTNILVTRSKSEHVAKHICLCLQSEQLAGEKLPTPKPRRWPPLQGISSKLSAQEDPCLTNSDNEDLHQTSNATPSTGELDCVEPGKDNNEDGSFTSSNIKRKDLAVYCNCRQPSTQKGDKPEHVSYEITDQELTRDDSLKRFSKCSHCATASPKMTVQELESSQSCFCQTAKGCTCSCLTPSSDSHLIRTCTETMRALSPTDSLDSCYTFVVSSPRYSNHPLVRDSRVSKSTVDLSRGSRPLINGKKDDLQQNQRSSGGLSGQTYRRSAPGRSLSGKGNGVRNRQRSSRGAIGGPSQVTRSVSMSVIEVPFSSVPRVELMGEGDIGWRERAEPVSVKEEALLCPSEAARLVRQFGKQGSGRADFTLPSGVHVTAQGQLFIVDCGNTRVQVTDSRGNVLQQLTTGGTQHSDRRCSNYFDIAVSAKGLIVLSCVAQRAILVFSRHGRHLQTFGGAGMGNKDELEAPRGVAINGLDEFLVADIRRGTLVVLKLDSKSGCKLECTSIPGFHRPYLVAACLSTGLVAVSERGSETGRAPCVKVLDSGWNIVRVLGICLGVGPLLSCPWGICIDRDGDVLVADWGKEHKVLIYPTNSVGRSLVKEGLSSPRGLALLPQGHLVVSDSMNHCIKIFHYK